MQTSKLLSLINTPISMISVAEINFAEGTHRWQREILLVFVTLIGFAIVKLIQRPKQNNKNGLKSLPGPIALPFLGNDLQFLPTRKMVKKFAENRKNFGSCYRLTLLGENYVVLSSAKLAIPLLSSCDNEYLKKPSLYKIILDPDLKEEEWSSAVTFGDHWKLRRKALTRYFSMQTLSKHLALFHQGADKLLHEVDKLFESGDKIHKQIHHQVASCILNVVTESLVGVNILSKEDFTEYTVVSERYLEILLQRAFHPWFQLRLVWNYHPLGREFREVNTRLTEIAMKAINHYRNLLNKKANDPEDVSRTLFEDLLNSGLSDTAIVEEIRALLFVGHGTTTLAFQNTLHCLALNPEHQEKCFQEIDKVFQNPGKYSDGELTSEALTDLVYLEQCFLESLRVAPVGWVGGRKLEKSMTLANGIVIPNGTNVLVDVIGVSEDPIEYPSPEIFDPNRFHPENKKSRESSRNFVFSLGPRNCIGKQFAILAMKIMLAKFLHKYHVTSKERLEDLVILPTVTANPETPVHFLFTKRNSNES